MIALAIEARCKSLFFDKEDLRVTMWQIEKSQKECQLPGVPLFFYQINYFSSAFTWMLECIHCALLFRGYQHSSSANPWLGSWRARRNRARRSTAVERAVRLARGRCAAASGLTFLAKMEADQQGINPSRFIKKTEHCYLFFFKKLAGWPAHLRN